MISAKSFNNKNNSASNKIFICKNYANTINQSRKSTNKISESTLVEESRSLLANLEAKNLDDTLSTTLLIFFHLIILL